MFSLQTFNNVRNYYNSLGWLDVGKIDIASSEVNGAKHSADRKYTECVLCGMMFRKSYIIHMGSSFVVILYPWINERLGSSLPTHYCSVALQRQPVAMELRGIFFFLLTFRPLSGILRYHCLMYTYVYQVVCVLSLCYGRWDMPVQKF